jgi:hypothetical protein
VEISDTHLNLHSIYRSVTLGQVLDSRRRRTVGRGPPKVLGSKVSAGI